MFDKTYSVEKINYWNNNLKVYNREFSKVFTYQLWWKRFGKRTREFPKTKKTKYWSRYKYYAKVNVAEIKLFDSVSVGDNLLIEGETTF